MPDHHRYILSVPVAKGHNVTIVSNREMTTVAWASLDRYLELQREIWAEDEAAGRQDDATPTQERAFAALTDTPTISEGEKG